MDYDSLHDGGAINGYDKEGTSNETHAPYWKIKYKLMTIMNEYLIGILWVFKCDFDGYNNFDLMAKLL